MSMTLRIKRLQQYLNAEHDAKLSIDGRFGSMTLGAAEAALGVEEWAATTKPKPKYDFDDRTETNLETLDRKAEPTIRELVSLAKGVADKHNVAVKVISGHRTWVEQDALYAQGRTRPGKIVTNARGGQSNHNFGIAVDFGVFSQDGKTYLDGGTSRQRVTSAVVHREIADAAKAAGLKTEWGGDWRSLKDFPHHEVATGLTMAQKRERYLSRGTVFL